MIYVKKDDKEEVKEKEKKRQKEKVKRGPNKTEKRDKKYKQERKRKRKEKDGQREKVVYRKTKRNASVLTYFYTVVIYSRNLGNIGYNGMQL